MVADLLGSLAVVTEDQNYSGHYDFDAADDLANDNNMEGDELQPVFVRGSVLDACAAHDRVARLVSSGHIAAIDSDDNGLYRLFRTP